MAGYPISNYLTKTKSLIHATRFVNFGKCSDRLLNICSHRNGSGDACSEMVNCLVNSVPRTRTAHTTMYSTI